MAEIKYEKLDHREHVLHRPDTYLGSTSNVNCDCYVFTDDGYVSKEELNINQGLLQIYLEALTNATDNKIRSEERGVKFKRLEVSISKSGKTKIINDGIIIPIEIDKKIGVYIPEMVFGMLLTSSNYDDSVERTVAGRNGLGISCTNIWSKIFSVRIYDSKSKQLYEQTWFDNMATKTEPKITIEKILGGSFVEISYVPDFKRFGLQNYTNDMLRLMHYQTVISAMLIGMSIKFNGDDIKITSLLNFSSLFNDDEKQEYINFKYDNSEAVLIPSNKKDGIQMGFVNGIFTPNGGTHVDAWSKILFKSLATKLETKFKIKLSAADIKKYFILFVKCIVDKPAFNGQFKDKLISPKLSEPVISDNDIRKITKWGVIETIKNTMKTKELKKLKGVEKKKSPVLDSYDPSNKKGKECCLILTEGLSAKTFAISGLSTGCFGKKGRSYFGIYALKGKVLNVRNANPDIISKNTEITGIINILGLKIDLNYTDDKNFKTLRYGKLMILSDQDSDGFHIASLIINFVHYLYPSLLKRQEPFIYSMMTPIIRITRGNITHAFYTHAEYNKFGEKTDLRKFKHQYFKGLGTSTDSEIKDCFGKRLLKLTYDAKDDDEALKKAFQKDLADTRKQWIKDGKPEEAEFVFENYEINYPISKYINNQLIEYSLEDCQRSLPNVIDGFKESQRKILYACFLKKIKDKIKVAQLSGYVAEKSNYHHGENNLCETIIGMAQNFVGSNNLPLLNRHGQFGSRIACGADAAQPRYIFTSLETWTRMIFKEEDDNLLQYRFEEGDSIEPMFYVPIIPMILVNGSEGIGTGWSCKIPQYNPLDIIARIKSWLYNEEIDEMIPWYSGYMGKIEKVSQYKYISYPRVKKYGNGYKITELPIGMSIDACKLKIEKLLNDGCITKRQNNSTSDKIDFEIECRDDFDINEINLITYIHTSNLVCYNNKNKLRKYETTTAMLIEFCKVRLKYYVERKKYIIKQYENKLQLISSKLKFLKDVISGIINLMEVDEINLDIQLEKLNYQKIDNSHEYLIKMPIKSFTKQNIVKLETEILNLNNELESIIYTTEQDMWIKELDDLESTLKN